MGKHAVRSILCICATLILTTGTAQVVSGDIPSAGTATSIDAYPEAEIAHGVKTRLLPGTDCLVCLTTMEPGAMIPEETLPAERIMIVMKGKVSQLIDGTYVPMTAREYETMTPVSGHRGHRDLVYLEKGAVNALKAGNEGAELIEVYGPARSDYLRMAGLAERNDIGIESQHAEPSIKPNRVYNYYDIPFVPITKGGFSRLISGQNVQLSFLRMEPGASFKDSRHPEEQIMVLLRGGRTETIGDNTYEMAQDDVVYIPSMMVHGAVTNPTGCDVLDVFTPVRDNFLDAMEKAHAAYHDIIPEDAEIELVLDGATEGPGLCFIEGPTWLDERLYFSSMHYDAAWNGDPKKSALVEMKPDGSYRYISYGDMETNGTFPLDNGNLAVCDMYGHRVVEMDTNGNVVRVLAGECEGKRLDGPNDLVVDMKGGVYFTDPQILPGPYMQPGRSVIYRKPSGATIRVVEPGVLIKPNGLILSPDGGTLYVNSTHEDFMMAYDVNEDGSLSNGRKFGKLMITPEFLDKESINTQADGMTVDEHGNVYITSILGLQIFSPGGTYIGTIHFPLMPVNCCFGDDDGKTLYVTCNDRIYRVRTRVRGAAYTLK